MKGGFKVGITVCAEKLSPSAPVVFTGDLEYAVRRCSELGYDGVELQLRNPDSLDRILLFSLLDRYGLRVSAIATGLEYTLAGLSMISDDEKVRTELRRRIFADIALAQKLGCPVIVGCIRGNIPAASDREKLLARFREELLLYSAEAQKHGVTLVIEAINFYINNYLCTVRETCDFIDSLGRDNVKHNIRVASNVAWSVSGNASGPTNCTISCNSDSFCNKLIALSRVALQSAATFSAHHPSILSTYNE